MNQHRLLNYYNYINCEINMQLNIQLILMPRIVSILKSVIVSITNVKLILEEREKEKLQVKLLKMRNRYRN